MRSQKPESFEELRKTLAYMFQITTSILRAHVPIAGLKYRASTECNNLCPERAPFSRAPKCVPNNFAAIRRKEVT